MQLHQPGFQALLAEREGRILAVSFAGLAELTDWVPYFRDVFVAPQRDGALPSGLFDRTRFLADPRLTTYQAYGLGRNSVFRVYGPRVVWPYLRWALSGRTIQRPRQDVLQRGGDFVVDRQRRVRFAHVGRDQADRPSLGWLEAALRAAG